MSNLLYTDEEFAILSTLAKNLHWIVQAEDGIFEFYLDHHMMATYRMCPSRFKLDFVDGWRLKGRSGWSLEFGILMHTVLEYYYTHFREPDFAPINAVNLAAALWDAGNFEQFKEIPKYKQLGGRQGLRFLVMNYCLRFAAENERLRIIGTELYFGKNKEVPLLENPVPGFPFRLYLTGKIDLLCDDGANISALDHKTASDFQGRDPNEKFLVQEGMTGYIYATKYMVRYQMGLDIQSRALNSILMNHIQVKSGKNLAEQYKRVRIYKTDEALEQYRRRQISTTGAIMNMLTNLFRGYQPYYNTSVCMNWFHNQCVYQPVHRVPEGDGQLIKLESLFEKGAIWNPETRDEAESRKSSLEHL